MKRNNLHQQCSLTRCCRNRTLSSLTQLTLAFLDVLVGYSTNMHLYIQAPLAISCAMSIHMDVIS